MDWSCSAGLLRLLRYSGDFYQFRHGELQKWLAQHPTPTASAGRHRSQ